MLLTVDIGTSSLKSSLWSYDGKCFSSFSFPLSVISGEEKKYEANPAQWLFAFENCCHKLVSCLNKKKLRDVSAVVISGNGPTLVPVFESVSFGNNEIICNAHNARLWLDRRAEKYQNKISELMDGFVDASFFLPKILYIKNEEKELYKKTKYFLGCPEYLAYALTDMAYSVFPSDGFDRFFWNNSVLGKLEIDSEKIPGFINPGGQFGIIAPKAANYFGFSNNVPVISGGPDFFAAILGAGITRPGEVCDRTGSSEGINVCTQNRVVDNRLMSYGHPIKPFWNLSGVINTTGKAVEWGLNLLGLSSFDKYYELAMKSKPGSKGLVFHPHLNGERTPVWDSSVRGLLHGISLPCGRNEFALSILEGICYAIRDVIDIMEKLCGINELRVTGGMAGIDFLNQMKADITGKIILEPAEKNAELLGLAIIGSCFQNKYASLTEASSQMVKIKKIFEPNPENKDLYDELFAEYSAGKTLINRIYGL